MPESFVPAALFEPPKALAGPRRPGRSRAAGLAVAAAGLALLAAAAGCSSGGQQKAGAAAPDHAAAPKGIQIPAQIGSLKKATSDDAKSYFDTLPSSVVKNLHSVNYDDATDSSSSVEISGGPGLPIPADSSGDKVSQMFSEWAVGAEREKLTKVSAGSVGGLAECAPDAANPRDPDCGWVNGNMALVISFTGTDMHTAQALVPKILTAMVRA